MDLKLPPDFKEFLRLLNAHGVKYSLIGGYSVGYYGYPKATQDLYKDLDDLEHLP